MFGLSYRTRRLLGRIARDMWPSIVVLLVVAGTMLWRRPTRFSTTISVDKIAFTVAGTKPASILPRLDINSFAAYGLAGARFDLNGQVLMAARENAYDFDSNSFRNSMFSSAARGTA